MDWSDSTRPESHRFPSPEDSADSVDAASTRYPVCRRPRALAFTDVRVQLRRGSVVSTPCGLLRYSQRRWSTRTDAAARANEGRRKRASFTNRRYHTPPYAPGFTRPVDNLRALGVYLLTY